MPARRIQKSRSSRDITHTPPCHPASQSHLKGPADRQITYSTKRSTKRNPLTYVAPYHSSLYTHRRLAGPSGSDTTPQAGTSPKLVFGCPSGASSVHAAQTLATHRSHLGRNCCLSATGRPLHLRSWRPTISHPGASPIIEMYHCSAHLFTLQCLGSRDMHPSVSVRFRRTPISVFNVTRILRITVAIMHALFYLQSHYAFVVSFP